MKIKLTIDARGLHCPAPLLKARQGLQQLAPGEYLQVLATDPTTVQDFPKMAEMTQHLLVSTQQTEDGFSYIFQRS